MTASVRHPVACTGLLDDGNESGRRLSRGWAAAMGALNDGEGASPSHGGAARAGAAAATVALDEGECSPPGGSAGAGDSEAATRLLDDSECVPPCRQAEPGRRLGCSMSRS